jgi:hypothetical protein
MNIREISDIFKDTADNITAIKSYNFGWASDRVRQGNTEDFQELNEFPRVFFAVPTITGSDQTRKQDTYQVTLFFDDLLGYDNEGDEDPTLQIDKWANLQQYANYFVQRLNKIKQSILPNYLFIPEAPSITFDSFTGLQRMITVQLSFNLVVPTNCDPGIITLVQCIANIVTSSNLTASLMTVLKFAASLEGRATVTADINFVQKAEASLLTSANVTGNLTIPKTFNASLLATGTTTADLTVGSSVDADAAAFFARVTAAGGTLTTTEQNAVNTLVVQMKADGIWTKMKAIYPMVGASAAACAQNLKSSSFTGSFSSGWTFASTGVKGNGTNAEFVSNFAINNFASKNSVAFGMYSRTNLVGNGVGMNAGVNIQFFSYYRITGQQYSYIFDGNNDSLLTLIYLGLNSHSRTSSSQKYVQNKTTITSFTSNVNNTGLDTSIVSFSRNSQGYDPNEYALFYISDGLTNTQLLTLNTNVEAFQETLNRQV